jgi:hypothetical protein
MSAVQDYITVNDLSALVWLNADSGNLFTWMNELGGSSTDFIQNNLSNHPVVSSNGISFTSNSFLYSRSALFVDVNDYTIIALSKDDLTMPQVLVKLQQGIASTEYDLVAGKIQQKYRPYQNTDIVTSDTANTNEVAAMVVKRRVKYGDTKLEVQGVQSNHKNLINSWRFDSDNSIIGQGTLNNLYHFLCFDEIVDTVHVEAIINLLIYSTPVLNPNPYWDLLQDITWDSLTTPLWDNIL